MKKLFTVLTILAIAFTACEDLWQPPAPLPSLTIHNESFYDLTDVKFKNHDFYTQGSSDLLRSTSAKKQFTADYVNQFGFIYFTRKDIGKEFRTASVIVIEKDETFTFLNSTVVIDTANEERKSLSEFLPPPINDAHLSSLQPTKGELKPEFNPYIFDYTLEIGTDQTEVNVVPKSRAANITSIEVNGFIQDSGVMSRNISLPFTSPVTIIVTAQDKTTKIYKVTLELTTPSINQARIGSTEYEFFSDAIVKAAAGSPASPTEIVLLKDVPGLGTQSISGKHIKLTVEANRSRTISARAGSFALFTVGSDASLTLRGNGAGLLTLDGGNQAAASDRRGVKVNSGGHLIMENNAYISKFIGNSGSGVYIDGDGTFTMSGGSIENNSTDGGGSVYIGDRGSFTMSGGTIQENEARANGCGGVHVNSNRSFTMSGGAIQRNRGATWGGGVYVQSGTFFMENGTIRDNTATSKGGGVSVNEGNFTMTGGTIENNRTDGDGGGVSVNGGTFKILGGAIKGNSADKGGGVYVYSGNFNITGGNIENNIANIEGGGVYVSHSCIFTMIGGIIKGNRADNGGGGGVNVNAAGSTFTMIGGSIEGNTASNQGGGVFLGGSLTFTMSGGYIYGINDKPLTNKAPKGDSSDEGAAIYVDVGAGVTARYGGPLGTGLITTDNNTLPRNDLPSRFSLDQTGTYTFPDDQQTAQLVTVTNTGNQATGVLTVALSGTNAGSFTLSTTSISSIAAGANDTFTVKPNTGLAVGTYTATVTVSGINSISAAFNVSFTVKVAPTYGINLSLIGIHTFLDATAGYVAAPDALSVTVTNAGNQATGALTVALTGTNASSFTLSKTEISSITTENGTDTFTVVPKAGLPASTTAYTATVTVSGGANITSKTFDVSFTVNPPPGISLSETGTYTFANHPVYSMKTALTVTVTNNMADNQATGPLTVALSGSNADSFTLSTTSINSIKAGGTDFFTVVPNTGLVLGTYTATVTVSGSNSISAEFDVIYYYFEYPPPPPPPTIGIEMVHVPGGSFQMGKELGTAWSGDTAYVHTVTLTGFYMSKYEVTQEQYEAVMGSNPSYFHGGSGREPASGEAQGKRPVESVSWYDAIVFCNKLSVYELLSPAYSINGSTDPAVWGTVPTTSNSTWNAAIIITGSTGYRLPTEAQWEYAAKGGNGTPGNYTYSGSNTVGEVAWYYDNSDSKTHEVGKKPNSLGIFDMSGNVWEWCWDRYGDYSSSAQTDPIGPAVGAYRVLRGGSWDYDAVRARSVIRYSYYPYYRYFGIGFRLVRPGT